MLNTFSASSGGPGWLNRYPNAILIVFAILIGALAIRPASEVPSVHAQSPGSNLYVEPGTTIIRSPDGTSQVQGKVVINLETGEVWGFPTLSGAPYPVDQVNPKPPVSEPVYLGKFDFAAMSRGGGGTSQRQR